jgi:hypothetical protein
MDECDLIQRETTIAEKSRSLESHISNSCHFNNVRCNYHLSYTYGTNISNINEEGSIDSKSKSYNLLQILTFHFNIK